MHDWIWEPKGRYQVCSRCGFVRSDHDQQGQCHKHPDILDGIYPTSTWKLGDGLELDNYANEKTVYRNGEDIIGNIVKIGTYYIAENKFGQTWEFPEQYEAEIFLTTLVSHQDYQ